MATPAFEKRNELTDIINQVKDINSQRGALAGRGARPIMIESGTSVRSAAMQRPPVLPSEEKARLDQKARDLGIKTEGPSLAEEVLMEVEKNRRPEEPPVPRSLGLRSLPNFTKVQALDLVNGVAIVDGMEFPIPESDIPTMKGYVVQLVTDAITARVAEALIEFGLPSRRSGGMDGTNETVQQVRGGEGAGVVQQGQRGTGWTEVSLRALPEQGGSNPSQAGIEAHLDAGIQGNDLPADVPSRVLSTGSANPIDFVVSPWGEVSDLRDARVVTAIDEDVAGGRSEVQSTPDS